MSEFVTPPPVERGDKVAIVSPASGLADRFPHVYERGLDRLRSVFDLEPVEFPTARESDSYLFDHPEERAEDVERAFADPEIAAVVSTIGGNDQIRILEHLDADVLRANPTRFYGISDNTNLAQFLWNQGVVSYYGGHLLTEFATPGPLPEYLESSLRTALFEESVGSIAPAVEFTDQDVGWDDPDRIDDSPEMERNPGWTWRGGDDAVEGRTWGGSLEITALQAAAGRYLPDPAELDGAVLLLETSEELPSPGEVQRVLLGLGERGLLSRFDGFLVGRVKARSHLVDRSQDKREAYRAKLQQKYVDVISLYNETAPIVLNVDFGHTNPIVPVPIGATATIDPAAERIAFD
ncbi:Muramoyltetrapeptide carboxypeptidase LdcA (peptidoglycan recycling) [Halogranum amylolyticum]|uniref:Muramoyltetrapeptide carboxypeptidase LdcA (Peptidoglycan recycling) n=1 Tax=Halogranum amylolyticum TaxID=660520 RepID=A0A1H8VZY1_9EURY|nr:S66 peptidase family protein [Halogranum amylolyticum]SEP20951.1 Muramoyltetrapeptide carboxypeptidase LdcA (peptidoglycan recycling) [Halogranum amylolyticum]